MKDRNPLLLSELFGELNFGGRGGENAVVLARFLQNTPFSQVINRLTHFVESSLGATMAIDAMKMLTSYAMEVTGLPVSKIDDKDLHDNALSLVAKLSQSYNVEWLEGYVRMVSMRLTFDKANRQDELLVAGISTHVMKGQVAVSVVKMFGIPIKDWALDGPAALYELSKNLPQADDLLPDEFRGDETIEGFLEALTQEGLRFVLTHHCDKVCSIYLFLADGDEDTADHNMRMLKKAYGIVDKPNDDAEESFDPSEIDISKLDALFGEDILVH